MPRLLKRWYVWLGLVLLLGLAGSVMLIYSSRSRITQANFELVREGMTKAEVLAVLGGCQQELTGRRCIGVVEQGHPKGSSRRQGFKEILDLHQDPLLLVHPVLGGAIAP